MADGIVVHIDASQLRNFVWKLKQKRKYSQEAKNTVAHEMAKDLVKFVQQNASGRPGPQVVTGAYRSSIMILDSEESENVATYDVGTRAVQAMRLEFGFVGVDAIGRHYHQPPFPHWRPGIMKLNDNVAKYNKMLKDAVA